jgi:hypothetical protein
MNFEQRQTYRRIADRVASELHAKLKAKAIYKIDIDAIRRALREQTECPRDAMAFDALEEMTTRCVVMKTI